MTTRILRLPAVLSRIGVSRSTVYRLIASGHFPAPRRLGPNSVGWWEADVEAWVVSRGVVG